MTGVHRTWLHPLGRSPALVDTPRRALGNLLGNAVRFGALDDVLVAGEGIETMLSLRCVLPTMPMVAAPFGQSPCRHSPPAVAAAAVYRSRCGCGRKGRRRRA
ncbi:DUF7146 domain-containing protein [Bradyrhizobium sp. 13971]